MPNWCACSIHITGSKKDMKLFNKTLEKHNEADEKTVFSFYQTVPRPESADWYTWNIKNWGTKWDCSEPTLVRKTHTEFLVQCDTAWSPPLAWGETVSRMFPNLTFTIAYCEAGMRFYGVWTRNGNNKETKTRKYEFLDDDIIGFRTENGVRVRDDKDPWEEEPNGRLKVFMEKYSLAHTGG